MSTIFLLKNLLNLNNDMNVERLNRYKMLFYFYLTIMSIDDMLSNNSKNLIIKLKIYLYYVFFYMHSCLEIVFFYYYQILIYIDGGRRAKRYLF